ARERFDQFGNESDSSDNTNKEDKEEKKSKDMEFSNINENSWCDDQFELSVNIK
ncbi:13698_t:CDS:2, partial [Entrophospora sp. SA101]